MSALRKEKTPVAGEQGGVFGRDIQQANHSPNREGAKAFSTWQARFAMHGHSLYQVKAADGATAYLVTRWGMVRELADIREVEKFFSLIGGKV